MKRHHTPYKTLFDKKSEFAIRKQDRIHEKIDKLTEERERLATKIGVIESQIEQLKQSNYY